MKKTLLLFAILMFGLIVLIPESSKPIKGASGEIPTFNKEVVRIFQQNCQVCHHPGYIAPFAIVDFKISKLYAPAIKIAVLEKRMPPWKAAPDCGNFLDARVLSNNDVETLVKWVDNGTPEGDLADLPPPLTFSDGWLL